MSFGIFRRALAGVLAAAQVICFAQEAGVPKLNIVIIEGDGAINNIKQRTAREVIVEVQDENHRPVGGALVAFTLPTGGPTGVLPGGQSLLSVTTDSTGRATLSNFQPTKVGKFKINVHATANQASANATVTQANVWTFAGISFGSTAAIAATVAGIAAAGAVIGWKVSTSGGGGPHATISVGPPRLP